MKTLSEGSGSGRKVNSVWTRGRKHAAALEVTLGQKDRTLRKYNQKSKNIILRLIFFSLICIDFFILFYFLRKTTLLGQQTPGGTAWVCRKTSIQK